MEYCLLLYCCTIILDRALQPVSRALESSLLLLSCTMILLYCTVLLCHGSLPNVIRKNMNNRRAPTSQSTRGRQHDKQRKLIDAESLEPNAWSLALSKAVPRYSTAGASRYSLSSPALVCGNIPTVREFLRRKPAEHQVFQHHAPPQVGFCWPVLPETARHPRHDVLTADSKPVLCFQGVQWALHSIKVAGAFERDSTR